MADYMPDLIMLVSFSLLDAHAYLYAVICMFYASIFVCRTHIHDMRTERDFTDAAKPIA